MNDLYRFAENDDDAMTILSDPDREGKGAQEYADWLAQFSVFIPQNPEWFVPVNQAIPIDVANGIIRFESYADRWLHDYDDDVEPVPILDATESPYGGGAVAMRWYRTERGDIAGVQNDGYTVYIPAERVPETPEVTLHDARPRNDEVAS